MKTLFILILFLSSHNTYSHTWNEPWHIEVVENSNSFGLFEVTKSSGNKLKIKLVKHLAGDKPKVNIKLSNFYLYELMSASDQHSFGFKKGQRVYMYLYKKGKKYLIATPTAGADVILDDGLVAATFRHSLHKTQLDTANYEKLQVCIFQELHNIECSQEVIDLLVATPLKQRVAILSPDASSEDYTLFFQQHAALETAFLISYPLPKSILDKFLQSDFFHVQISAVRALSVSNNPDKISKLVEYVIGDEASDIAKVMAIIMLNNLKTSEGTEQLQAYFPQASEENVFLGNDIMDPRVGTWYPESVKDGLEWYLSQKAKHNKSIQ